MSFFQKEDVMRDYNEEVRAAMITAGVTPPEEHLIFDGKIHRYKDSGDKPNTRNGWYMLYEEGIPSGAFGNWKTGIKSKWCSKSLNLMSSEEKTEYRKRMKDAFLQRQRLKEQDQQKAAELALDIWEKSEPANPNHAYLVNKAIPSFIARQHDNYLVLPITNIEGKICSLQFIYPDGSKRLFTGGAKKGNFILVNGLISNSEIRIVEGFATACSLAQSYPDSCVIAAIDAGNMEPVAMIIRRHQPQANIFIYADDDRLTEGNPGATKGRAAAIAASALLVLPAWPKGSPLNLTDFNDLASWLATTRGYYMSKLSLNIDSEIDVREHREQREQPNNDVGFDCSQKAAPTGNTENTLPMIIINPVDTPPPILLNPKIDRPCYSSYSDWFEINGKKLQPGLYWHGVHTSRKDETTDIDQWISLPLTVSAITSSESGEDFGALLKFMDSNGKWHEWAMPMPMLRASGEELLGELLNQGLTFHRQAKNKLLDYIMSERPKRRIIAATRVGWNNDVFVLPNQVIGNSKADVVFQSEMANESEFKMHGTLEGWKNEIGSLCVGNTPLMVSLCMALAGPLLKKVNRKQGGGIHWVGDSSTGKSTAAEVAATVWGSSDFINSWSATANGLEGRATMRNDTCLILDEIDEALPQEIGKIIYMLANGQGKQRAGRIGNARKIQRWRTMTISTGERTLSNIMSEAGKHPNAGQLIRLLNIPAGFENGIFSDLHGFKDGRTLADHLKSVCGNHYGHLGPAFVESLMKDTADLPGLLADLTEVLCANIVCNFESRSASMFALLGLAGELAIEYKLIPGDKGDAFNAVKIALDQWRMFQGSSQNEHSRILQDIKGFIAKHGDSRFSPHKANSGAEYPVYNRAGWYKDDGGERVYMFLPEALEAAGSKFDRNRIVAALSQVGWIVEYDIDRKTKKTRTPSGLQSLYYICIKEEI